MMFLDKEECRPTAETLMPNVQMRTLLKNMGFKVAWEIRRPMVQAYNARVPWDGLQDTTRATAREFGYTSDSWGRRERKFEYYSSSVYRRLARISAEWDVEDMDRAAKRHNEFDTLPIHTARAATNAGFSRESWNSHIEGLRRLTEIDLTSDTEEEQPVVRPRKLPKQIDLTFDTEEEQPVVRPRKLPKQIDLTLPSMPSMPATNAGGFHSVDVQDAVAAEVEARARASRKSSR